MRDIENKVFKKVCEKLNDETLLRSEIDNPYVEKYIEVAAEAIIIEVFKAIREDDREKQRKLANSMRSSGFIW